MTTFRRLDGLIPEAQLAELEARWRRRPPPAGFGAALPGAPPWVEISDWCNRSPHSAVVRILAGSARGPQQAATGLILQGGAACLTAAHFVRAAQRNNAPIWRIRRMADPVSGATVEVGIERPQIPPRWDGVRGSALDVALLHLSGRLPGASEVLLARLSDSDLNSYSEGAAVVAYDFGSRSGSRPRVNGKWGSNSEVEALWAAPITTLVRATYATHVAHYSQTVPLWSGAPLLAKVNGVWCSLGVHVSDRAATERGWHNNAVRFFPPASDWIMSEANLSYF